MQNYAILLYYRARTDSGKFPNIIKLYKSWLTRLEEDEDGKKQENLLKQLRTLQTKRATSGTTLPPPLGTDLDIP